MTNTAVAGRHAVTCICSNKTGKDSIEIVENLLKIRTYNDNRGKKYASCNRNFRKWNSFLDETY